MRKHDEIRKGINSFLGISGKKTSMTRRLPVEAFHRKGDIELPKLNNIANTDNGNIAVLIEHTTKDGEWLEMFLIGGQMPDTLPW